MKARRTGTRIRRLIALAIWVGIVTTASMAEERELFSGAALLYTVPKVTVVYPAGPGQDREWNRISAERRASYLRGRHNTETVVIADVDMTEETRKGHLLVLGWNNLLVEETGQIELTESSWKFQGLERSREYDLLFSWVSPFEKDREFVFWSRIDPELDRYLVLPFFGSDWIVFDGYTIEQYGRFVKSDLAWPPKRNPSVEIDNRPDRPRPRPMSDSQHYELFDRGAGLDKAAAARILEARENAWGAAVAAIGAPPEPVAKIKLYVYLDSDMKETLCDVHDARHHDARRNELHLTRAIAMNPSLHEDIHLIARQVFGPAYLSLFVEGLAVWAEQQQGEDELHVYANMLARGMDAPGIVDLLDEETMRVLVRNRVGFPVAGLFMAWLRAESGPDVFSKVYGQYASDPEQLAEAIGVPVDEIDTRFEAFVQAQAERGETEAEFRAATSQARHFGGLGDYERAIPALQRALEIQPDHLFTRYSLAVAHMNIDDLDAAEAEFKRILEYHRDSAKDNTALLSWFQLGELYSRRGNAEKSRESFLNVLGLADFGGMHERTRRLLAELETN